jgi:hypothetical protein
MLVASVRMFLPKIILHRMQSVFVSFHTTQSYSKLYIPPVNTTLLPVTANYKPLPHSICTTYSYEQHKGLEVTTFESLRSSYQSKAYNNYPKWVKNSLFFIWRNSPQRVRASSFTWFLDHIQRRTTVGMTPLDEWSARRWDLYLTNTKHSQQTSMPPVGFEPTISAVERQQRGHWHGLKVYS